MQSINKIKEYFVSMEMYEGRWVIVVKYRPKWGAYSSEDGKIKVSADESQEDVWWYYATDDKVEVDDIINLITETVATNIEAIKKVELFKMKAGELKQIFSDESLSFKTLQTLKFVFDDSIKPNNPIKEEPSKKVTSKKELLSNIDEEIKEHDILQPEEKKEETKSKNKPRKKKAVEESTIQEEKLEGVTPDEMTQDEINELRG